MLKASFSWAALKASLASDNLAQLRFFNLDLVIRKHLIGYNDDTLSPEIKQSVFKQ